MSVILVLLFVTVILFFIPGVGCLAPFIALGILLMEWPF